MTIETLKSPNPRNRKSVSSMNTLLAILKVTDARRDVILAGGLYHRFPWRHLPPHPPESEEKRGEMCRPVIMVAQFLDLKNLSWQRRPFALSNDGRNVWANVLFPSATMHTKVTHANFFLPYLQDCGLLRSRSFSTGVEEGAFCRGGLHSPQVGAIYSHKKGWFLASF